MESQLKLLGQILVQGGVITPDQLHLALTLQAKSGKRVGEILIESGAATEDDIVCAVAAQYGVVTLKGEIEPNDDLLSRMGVPFARHRVCAPLGERDGKAIIALGDILDVEATDALGRLLKRTIRYVAASPSAILRGLDRYEHKSDRRRRSRQAADRAALVRAGTEQDSNVIALPLRERRAA